MKNPIIKTLYFIVLFFSVLGIINFLIEYIFKLFHEEQFWTDFNTKFYISFLSFIAFLLSVLLYRIHKNLEILNLTSKIKLFEGRIIGKFKKFYLDLFKKEIQSFQNNYEIEINTRERLLDFTNFLLKNAKKSIQAFNFIDIKYWNDKIILENYKNANKDNLINIKRKKIRIHFYDDNIKDKKEEFIKFNETMDNLGFEIRFYSESEYKISGELEGLVIVDEECVIIFDKPWKIANGGKILFDNIDKYKEKFEKYYKLSKSYDVFIRENFN